MSLTKTNKYNKVITEIDKSYKKRKEYEDEFVHEALNPFLFKNVISIIASYTHFVGKHTINHYRYGNFFESKYFNDDYLLIGENNIQMSFSNITRIFIDNGKTLLQFMTRNFKNYDLVQERYDGGKISSRLIFENGKLQDTCFYQNNVGKLEIIYESGEEILMVWTNSIGRKLEFIPYELSNKIKNKSLPGIEFAYKTIKQLASDCLRK